MLHSRQTRRYLRYLLKPAHFYFQIIELFESHLFRVGLHTSIFFRLLILNAMYLRHMPTMAFAEKRGVFQV